MEVHDIIQVKDLDYSKTSAPEDEQAKKQWEEIVKELTSLQGLALRVVSLHMVDGNNYVVAEGVDRKNITIDGNTHSITLREDEVELVETDYLNNCCRQSMGFYRESFICNTCGFNIGTLIRRHTKTNKTSKAKQK